MSYEIVDTLYRSRKTLLDHLEQEGYDIAPFSKFSPKEIAEALGIPERTVRTHLLRGLRMLKESVRELE